MTTPDLNRGGAERFAGLLPKDPRQERRTALQSFEADPAARQVLGFTDAPVEYEEAFGLDTCFGDMVLQTTLALLEDL